MGGKIRYSASEKTLADILGLACLIGLFGGAIIGNMYAVGAAGLGIALMMVLAINEEPPEDFF